MSDERSDERKAYFENQSRLHELSSAQIKEIAERNVQNVIAFLIRNYSKSDKN